MQSPPSSVTEAPRETVGSAGSWSRSSHVRRLVFAGTVLLIEYLTLSYAFDAHSVAQRGGIWSAMGHAGKVGPLVVVAATVMLLFPGLRTGARASSVARAPNPRLLLAHVVLAGCFFALTHSAFGRPQEPAGPAALWVATWLLAGIATAGTLFAGVLGEVRPLLRGLTRVALFGGGLGLAAWAAGRASTLLWAPLSTATFVTVSWLLELLSFEPWVESTTHTLRVEDFAVTVAPVCSGFEGIGLFAVLMSAFLYHFRSELRFPRALLLLPLGMGAVWLGNALRIALLMVVGARVDPEVALGSFHSKAGWVFFCGITLAMATWARRGDLFRNQAADAEASAPSYNPTTPYLLPVLTWIGLGLATSSLSEGHDPLYAVRVIGTAFVLWHYRSAYHADWSLPGALSIGVGAAIGVVWLLQPQAPSPAPLEPGAGAWTPVQLTSWLVFRSLGAIVVVPLAEELAFRGYLARWISRRDFWNVGFTHLSTVGVLLSSVAFGLVHDRWILGTATGVAYALLLRRSGRLSDAIAAHGASNLVIAAWVMGTGAWHHW